MCKTTKPHVKACFSKTKKKQDDKFSLLQGGEQRCLGQGVGGVGYPL